MFRKNINTNNAKALILGATFKENCPDLRNSKVVDLYRELIDFGFNVEVFDPQADSATFHQQYGKDKIEKPSGYYDLIILAVAHEEFKSINPKSYLSNNGVVYDIKSFYNDPEFISL